MVSASSTWSRPSRTAACQRSKPSTSCAERGAGARRQAAVGDEQAGGVEQRDAVLAGGAVDLLQRLVADAALRHVDDALEGEAVVGRDRDAEVGHGVADLLALVEARAADDAVGQADGQEAVLEGAHLVRGADEDGDAVGADRVEAAGAAGERLDLLADPARLLLAVPVADQPDLLALGDVGPERLAEAALVGGDDAGGGGEDVRGRAVVLLEADHLRAGEVLLEAQDVADLGAAPAVDRLVVVADAADVAVARRRAGAATGTARRWCPGTRRRGCSGTSAGTARARRGGSAGWRRRAAAGRRSRRRSGSRSRSWYCGVELGAAVVEGAGFRGGHALGGERAVLPAVDQAGEQARRPALLVDVARPG